MIPGRALLRRPSLTQLRTATFPALELPTTMGELVLLFDGDSRIAGLSSVSTSPSGPRRVVQHRLQLAGIPFRCVGVRGLGGRNGTGNNWGVTNLKEDYYQCWQPLIQDAHNEGHFGRQWVSSATITNVNTGTGTFTCSAQIFANGSYVALTVAPGGGATLPTSSAIAPVTVNGVTYLAGFATNVINSGGTQTFQLAQLDNTTVATITGAGSGTITALAGLAEILAPASAFWGLPASAVTDVIMDGGANDISILTDAGASGIDATLEARFELHADAVDLLMPNARKHMMQGSPIVSPLANFAAKQAHNATLNAYLASYLNSGGRGNKWTLVPAAAGMSATMMFTDGIHHGPEADRRWGTAAARSVISSCGHPNAVDIKSTAQQFMKRRQTGSFMISAAATQRATFANSAARNPGTGNFWFAISVMLLAKPTGVNAILQLSNPYTSGWLLNQTASQFSMYWRQAGASLPVSALTAYAEPLEWARLFGFFDLSTTPNQCSLWLNGNYVQTVYCDAASVTTTPQLFIGGSSLNSALMLVKDLALGVNSPYTILDVAKLAQRDYWLGELGDEASELILFNGDLTSQLDGGVTGTNTGGTFLAAGRWPCPWEQGYVRPRWRTNPLGTITATTGREVFVDEFFTYDATAGAINPITIPSPTGNEGRTLSYAEVGGSTNNVTIAGTINGVANPVFNTAGQKSILVVKDGAWRSAA
jgi:hypothetical protein